MYKYYIILFSAFLFLACNKQADSASQPSYTINLETNHLNIGYDETWIDTIFYTVYPVPSNENVQLYIADKNNSIKILKQTDKYIICESNYQSNTTLPTFQIILSVNLELTDYQELTPIFRSTQPSKTNTEKDFIMYTNDNNEVIFYTVLEQTHKVIHSFNDTEITDFDISPTLNYYIVKTPDNEVI